MRATHLSYSNYYPLAWWLKWVKNLPAIARRLGFHLWLRKIPWRRKWLPPILAWEITWTEKPGGLQSMGLKKWGGHDLVPKQQPSSLSNSEQEF